MIKKGALLATMLFTFCAFAQETTSAKNDLVSQITEIKESSNNYQDYKVIKAYKVDEFIKTLSDSLSEKNMRFTKLESQIKSLELKMQQQQQDLDSAKTALNEVTAEKNEMRFIGIPVLKSNYRIIMWSIIGVLVLLSVLLVNRFKSKHAAARTAKENFEEIEEEFAEYKKRSLEREQKLRREIIDLERKNQM